MDSIGCDVQSKCSTKQTVHEFHWDKADLSLYYDKTREFLSKIVHISD